MPSLVGGVACFCGSLPAADGACGDNVERDELEGLR